MVKVIISEAVAAKLLEKHAVTGEEIPECFENRYGAVLIDDRAIHRRTPPTLWFVAETTGRRLLKIVFQIRDGDCHIITAYEPNADEVRIYEKLGT
jgi:uncharacterized DUF497 family protein